MRLVIAGMALQAVPPTAYVTGRIVVVFLAELKRSLESRFGDGRIAIALDIVCLFPERSDQKDVPRKISAIRIVSIGLDYLGRAGSGLTDSPTNGKGGLLSQTSFSVFSLKLC
jgi:hypothetical protein